MKNKKRNLGLSRIERTLLRRQFKGQIRSDCGKQKYKGSNARYNDRLYCLYLYDFPRLYDFRKFLLQLLKDEKRQNIIRWAGDEGEFKFIQPEAVAKLWGAHKNKDTMNFGKLSRALRYYYSIGVISKVEGIEHCYKFMILSDEKKKCFGLKVFK